MCAGAERTPYLDAWVERFKKLKGLEEIEVVRKLSGGDPIVTIPGEYITDGIMVVGGAAGQSGIGYAMRAGQICGDVAADAVKKGNVSKIALLEYRKIWEREKVFIPFMNHFIYSKLKNISPKMNIKSRWLR